MTMLQPFPSPPVRCLGMGMVPTGRAGGMTVPGVPTNVTATAETQGAAINFDLVTGAVHYKVYQDGTLVDTLGNNAVLHVSGLNPGQTYVFTVSAANAAGESAQSAGVSVVPLIPTTNGALWLKGDSLSTGAVSSWADSFGVTGPAVQASGGSQPTAADETVNGLTRRVISFQGSSNQWLSFLASAQKVFAVAKCDDANPFLEGVIGSLFGGSVGINAPGRVLVLYGSAFFNPNGYDQVVDGQASVPVPVDSYHIVAVDFGALKTWDATEPGMIGAEGNGGRYFNGRIAEIVMYTTDDSDRDTVVTQYLASKYAIALIATPQNLTATPGSGIVTVSCDAVAGATGYNAYVNGSLFASGLSSPSYNASFGDWMSGTWQFTALDAYGETALSTALDPTVAVGNPVNVNSPVIYTPNGAALNFVSQGDWFNGTVGNTFEWVNAGTTNPLPSGAGYQNDNYSPDTGESGTGECLVAARNSYGYSSEYARSNAIAYSN